MKRFDKYENRCLDIQNKINLFHKKCQESGLKFTPQRMAVYTALIKSKDHPSAEILCKDIRKTFPSISLDTVNRTLITIHELGFSFTVEGTGESKRYDGNLSDHQHFKCFKCKKVTDIFDEDFGEIQIPKVLVGMEISRKTVYFEGICPKCIEEKK